MGRPDVVGSRHSMRHLQLEARRFDLVILDVRLGGTRRGRRARRGGGSPDLGGDSTARFVPGGVLDRTAGQGRASRVHSSASARRPTTSPISGATVRRTVFHGSPACQSRAAASHRGGAAPLHVGVRRRSTGRTAAGRRSHGLAYLLVRRWAVRSRVRESSGSRTSSAAGGPSAPAAGKIQAARCTSCRPCPTASRLCPRS